jgi:type I restriction enzyme S subunit
MSGAVGHKRVTKEFIEDSLIPIPSIEKQRELILTIRRIFETSQILKISSEKKLKELALLKTSVLNQAFSGELISE